MDMNGGFNAHLNARRASTPRADHFSRQERPRVHPYVANAIVATRHIKLASTKRVQLFWEVQPASWPLVIVNFSFLVAIT